MRVVLIEPPAVQAVDWDQAKAHLRLVDDDEEEFVMGLVDAATATIDGPAGWLGRAILPQTLEARFDGFPWADPIELSYPPLIDVTSVTYLDGAGMEQTLASSAYAVLGNLIEPAFGTSWPSARLGRETVRVRYEAGYETVPAPIRSAILMKVEAEYVGDPDGVITSRADKMLGQYWLPNL